MRRGRTEGGKTRTHSAKTKSSGQKSRRRTRHNTRRARANPAGAKGRAKANNGVNRAAALKGLAEVDVSDQRRLHRVLIAVATTLRGEDARVWQSTRAAVTATLRKKKTPMKMISQLLNSFFGHSASASAPPSNQVQASGQADAPGAEPPGTADWAKAVRFPFRLTADGVEYVNEDDEGNIDWSPLCSRLEVRALTRTSESEAWGRFLKWRDPDQHEHYWAMPAELLAGNGTQIRAVLLDGGLIVMSGVNAARRPTNTSRRRAPPPVCAACRAADGMTPPTCSATRRFPLRPMRRANALSCRRCRRST